MLKIAKLAVMGTVIAIYLTYRLDCLFSVDQFGRRKRQGGLLLRQAADFIDIFKLIRFARTGHSKWHPPKVRVRKV